MDTTDKVKFTSPIRQSTLQRDFPSVDLSIANQTTSTLPIVDLSTLIVAAEKFFIEMNQASKAARIDDVKGLSGFVYCPAT